ncbi:MAG: STAS domain-containing protein [Candidatus Aceula meridiana]|nr:STAS domain-containing protein [Candidatus Aceula meridiana]
MPLDIFVNKKETGDPIFVLAGAVDAETYSELEKEIENALLESPKNIVLDLARLQYISSMGLSVLVKAEKVLQGNKGALILINLPPQIKKVIDVISSLPSMNIFKNMEEADAYLLKIQRDEVEKNSL